MEIKFTAVQQFQMWGNPTHQGEAGQPIQLLRL